MIRGELVISDHELEDIVEGYLNSRCFDDIEAYLISPCGTRANPNTKYTIYIKPKDADQGTVWPSRRC